MVQEIVKAVIETGRRIAKRSTQRFSEAAPVGSAVRQGDVYICLLARVPVGAKKIETPMQLAPGTTQGSRHTLDSGIGVKAYSLKDASEFDGPILEISEDRTVCHPENGDWVLPPGTYGISYQRTQDSLDRARRVQD